MKKLSSNCVQVPIDSSLYSCGKVEDNYNFCFSCTEYCVPRNELFNAVFRIDSLHSVDTHAMLWGDDYIGLAEKWKSIFKRTSTVSLKEIRSVLSNELPIVFKISYMYVYTLSLNYFSVDIYYYNVYRFCA